MSFGIDEENLFNNLGLAIISFILVILMNDSDRLLLGEIRCWSL